MTNLGMLCEGLKEIACNHGFNAKVDNLEEGDYPCIWGGTNIPTYCDVEMLCEDVGIGRECLDEDFCGISVIPTDRWMDTMANKEYVRGLEMWRRH